MGKGEKHMSENFDDGLDLPPDDVLADDLAQESPEDESESVNESEDNPPKKGDFHDGK
jgi:hypothetical protein